MRVGKHGLGWVKMAQQPDSWLPVAWPRGNEHRRACAGACTAQGAGRVEHMAGAAAAGPARRAGAVTVTRQASAGGSPLHDAAVLARDALRQPPAGADVGIVGHGRHVPVQLVVVLRVGGHPAWRGQGGKGQGERVRVLGKRRAAWAASRTRVHIRGTARGQGTSGGVRYLDLRWVSTGTRSAVAAGPSPAQLVLRLVEAVLAGLAAVQGAHAERHAAAVVCGDGDGHVQLLGLSQVGWGAARRGQRDGVTVGWRGRLVIG